MPFDLKFDPTTNDVIDDGKGGLVETATADTMVYHQILLHYNEWWGDSTAGSKLFNLNNFQANPEVMVPDECKRALGVLVARGRISMLKVIAEMQGPSRVVTQSSFRDTSTGLPVTTFATAGG